MFFQYISDLSELVPQLQAVTWSFTPAQSTSLTNSFLECFSFRFCSFCSRKNEEPAFPEVHTRSLQYHSFILTLIKDSKFALALSQFLQEEIKVNPSPPPGYCLFSCLATALVQLVPHSVQPPFLPGVPLSSISHSDFSTLLSYRPVISGSSSKTNPVS